MSQANWKTGENVRLGSHTVTADEIIAFAKHYDPQPFHLDDAAARQTHFGALCASGWHTCGLWMRAMVDWTSAHSPTDEGRVSPGIRNLKWLKPVYAGDTLTFFTRLTGSRLSQSRPGYRILSTEGTAVNQNGETVLSFKSAVIVRDTLGTP